jgi:hypothetical protein
MVTIQGAVRKCEICLNLSVMPDNARCKICDSVYDLDDIYFEPSPEKIRKTFFKSDYNDWDGLIDMVGFCLVAGLCGILFLNLLIHYDNIEDEYKNRSLVAEALLLAAWLFSLRKIFK